MSSQPIIVRVYKYIHALQVQVGQLAVANDRLQSLQQREADHQGVLEECRTLRAALTEMETLLAHARARQAQAEEELAEAKGPSRGAAAGAEQAQEELQRTCLGLQHHLAARKASMDACSGLLHAARPLYAPLHCLRPEVHRLQNFALVCHGFSSYMSSEVFVADVNVTCVSRLGVAVWYMIQGKQPVGILGPTSIR